MRDEEDLGAPVKFSGEKIVRQNKVRGGKRLWSL